MATGVRVLEDVGGGEVFVTHSDSIVRGGYFADRWVESSYLLAKGIYLVETHDEDEGEIIPGSRATYTYPLIGADMPAPVEGAIWQTEAVVSEGMDLRKEVHVYRFGDETTVTIGACDYRMIPVSLTFVADDFTDHFHYLPELGFAYYAGAEDSDGSVEWYTYVKIEKVME